MSYTKVTFVLTPYSADASYILIALLGELGFESFEENSTGFDGYINSEQLDLKAINNLNIPFENTTFSFTIEELPDKNWNEEWEKNYFQPIIIENQVVVRGPFHPKFPETPNQIVIEPKMAFGTGHHETTGLMMKFILKTSMTDLRVLDMGCGTGILGILASMKGAKEVIGIDIDKWSYENTIENCDLNLIANMRVFCGDASLLKQHEPFDCILANINRNILLSDIKEYSSVLNHKGHLFLSGFYSEDLKMITKEAEKHSLKYLSKKEQNNWVAASYIKNS